MIKVISSVKSLDFRQLTDVYADELFGQKSNQKILEAEQDFYQFLFDFFKIQNAFYALWVIDGQYLAALRMEPYQDGVLLAGLHTAPGSRRKGYAENLLQAVFVYLQQAGCKKIYSHIRNGNIPSVMLHKKCGFEKILDYAAYIDGSVDHRSATYIKNI